ncbi:MAG: hypothetical protein U5K37_03575 [Natrialbaceae archaeon]|nr:hypothetical protein [Natrialbaceae archaeon]
MFVESSGTERDVTDAVSVRIDDESVLQYDDGTLRAMESGTTTVTIRYNDQRATETVTVAPPSSDGQNWLVWGSGSVSSPCWQVSVRLHTYSIQQDPINEYPN